MIDVDKCPVCGKPIEPGDGVVIAAIAEGQGGRVVAKPTVVLHARCEEEFRRENDWPPA